MSNKAFCLRLCMVLFLLILVACKQGTAPTRTPTPALLSTQPATATIASTTTPSPTSMPTPTASATSTRVITGSPTRTTTPEKRNEVVSCPGAPEISLKLNDWAMVSMDPPLPNKIRSKPSVGGELIGQVQPGENVLVVDGPICADGYTWWFVRSLEGLEGWTVEGDSSGYWLVDPISAWYQIPKPLAPQGIKTYDLRELKISADQALIGDITGSYNPLATPLPLPQNSETPAPEDPRYSPFGTASYAAHSFYEQSSSFESYIMVYDLEDPLSHYYLNHMSYDDCTQALKSALKSQEIAPAYLDPFCGINGGIPLLFKAGIKRIQFTGGEGVRYLIASGNNLTVNEIYFVFQGLSDDGRYFIRGYFRPITHPYIVDVSSLENDFGPVLAWKEGQYEQAQKSYDLFNTRIEKLLNADVVTLYPSLEFLDDMMASIVMK